MQLNINALRALRETSGDTQESLAERAGISEVAYWRIENGVSDPRSNTVKKLADALGVPVGAISHIDQKAAG
jgi:transcriptional regulator with XRE-family HTH domain